MEQFYEVLGINATASVEEIKKAYREKLKEVHPDLQNNEKWKDFANLQTQIVTEAYNAIIGSPCNIEKLNSTHDFICINGGSFLMGSHASELGRYDDERLHKVWIDDFFISKYTVTQLEYENITGINNSKFKGSKLPVTNISWYEAIDFCNKLSTIEHLSPAYIINKNGINWDRTSNGYRLPTWWLMEF